MKFIYNMYEGNILKLLIEKENSRENQVFNLLLIGYIFPKKTTESKNQNEKMAYGLSPG